MITLIGKRKRLTDNSIGLFFMFFSFHIKNDSYLCFENKMYH